MSEETQEKTHQKRRVIVDLKFQSSLIGSFFKIYLISTAGFYLIVAILMGKLKLFAKEKNLEELLNFISDIEGNFLWLFLIVFLISTALTYYFGFRVTQKVSGPILAMKMYLDKVKNGEEEGAFSLRKDDYFLELQDSLNETISSLKDK